MSKPEHRGATRRKGFYDGDMMDEERALVATSYRQPSVAAAGEQ
jgi:hypothetical protein